MYYISFNTQAELDFPIKSWHFSVHIVAYTNPLFFHHPPPSLYFRQLRQVDDEEEVTTYNVISYDTRHGCGRGGGTKPDPPSHPFLWWNTQNVKRYYLRVVVVVVVVDVWPPECLVG